MRAVIVDWAREVASGNGRTLSNACAFLPSRMSSYAFIAALVGSLLEYRRPLRQLLTYSASSEYSFIPLIPLISAFLILVRRNRVFTDAKPSPGTGIPIVAGSILLFLIRDLVRLGSMGRLELSALAMVSTWFGLFVLWYGAHAVRMALVPLFLLLFMIPAPESATRTVVELLQHGSAILSYHLFRVIGVPAIREGMSISLPRLTIEVAPQCSGIRSSISLLILILAGGDMYLRSEWNKVLLAAILVPLVILKNAIRIVTLSVLALYLNRSFLSGRLHRQGGILFFLIAAAMLIPVVAIMRRYETKRAMRPSSK